MKRTLCIAATLAALSGSAHALTIAESDNTGGGLIQITTEECRADPQFLKALSFDRKGHVSEGCWNPDSDDSSAIRIVWTHYMGKRITNTMSMYPISNWRMTRQGNALIGK